MEPAPFPAVVADAAGSAAASAGCCREAVAAAAAAAARAALCSESFFCCWSATLSAPSPLNLARFAFLDLSFSACCGAEFFLDDWKAGKIRIAGVDETRELFEYSGNHYEWAMKTFAKPGAPFSIFYAAAVDDSVWISPNIPKTIEGWIRNALE